MTAIASGLGWALRVSLDPEDAQRPEGPWSYQVVTYGKPDTDLGRTQGTAPTAREAWACACAEIETLLAQVTP